MVKKIVIIIAALILVAGGVWFFIKPAMQGAEPSEVNIKIDSLIPLPELKFGIAIDSFNMESGKVRRNQSLSDILTDFDVSKFTIHQIAQNSKGVYDFRRIRRRNKYHVFRTKDSLQQVKHFVYESSRREYVRVDLDDTVRVSLMGKEIVKEFKIDTGTVQTSLWNAMLANKINPVMANELSEIYAWSIDFFGLKQGDKFKIIYEEEFIDSVSVGIAKIHSAHFIHNGESFYAFNFKQNGRESYFDEKGSSLRKAFLKAPLRFSRISSGFTYSRMHPILKYRRPHTGVDYAAPKGTPVHTIGDGVVIKKGYTKGAGYFIKIKHNSVYTTGYNHFSRYPKGIKVGDRVKQGQVIGYVGATGYATGPHLDFRMWRNGKAVNPLKVKAPPVEPVQEDELAQFKKDSKFWKGIMDFI